ncbi:MAG: 16S rRNA (uracil(1498)-N(3))-methyltransferase [Bacteroidales bacterium]|nr:16S rRNA (uracil(1498)-N(3))-methyltransferase [Bacteroidales bacterium]
MELFYTNTIDGDRCFLDEEESRHCIKVLRHRKGDQIDLIDGLGTLLHGVIEDDNPRATHIQITERTPDWGGHPYRLDLAVCPPKNAERYDWFVEKAVEIGVDTIIPVIGDHSERRVLKIERLQKIAVSAAKQSLKAYIPKIVNPLTVKDFIRETSSVAETTDPATAHDDCHITLKLLKLFACCFDIEGHPRISIRDALASISTDSRKTGNGTPTSTDTPETATTPKPHVIIMIGPEGDFSPEEAQLAMAHGFIPIHLGPSRLRTETAALLSTLSLYTEFI